MKVYNSLTNKKEEFKSIVPGEVKMYSCGPTVYNYFHIGNARPFIIFDTLRRYLEYTGYKVTFVQNFTDIDDKMIKNANAEGITVKELAEKFINEYFIDAKGLGIKEATIHPKATENIDAIIDTVKKLEEKGYAYNVVGNVYFRTKKFESYGKLSHQPLEDLEAGARIEVNTDKEDPMDFVLWKNKKEGEPYWESPWGQGRPGWHIECSAMVNKYLGDTIDIHSGGKDLIFPHHENEIAQSEALSGKPFANYWLHNGFINIDNKKMSKSEGNFFTVRDIVKEFDYPVIRFFMLSAHYRSPINFSKDLVTQAKVGLERILNTIDNVNYILSNQTEEKMSETEREIYLSFETYKAKFKEAMDDDLNTADAISHIFSLVREVNTKINNEGTYSKELCKKTVSLTTELISVLGISYKGKEDDLDKEVEALIEKRQEARKNKDFKLADEIRDKLTDMGIILEDTRQGVKWRKA
ncbi:MAG: cysteine--tRNA ligase [Ruminococcaceae bacterium]|nr:cysteine--tRNA ligase [Oscillospiraceae bacterium]